MYTPSNEQPVEVQTAGVSLTADLALPPNRRAIVMFAHGSGSSRKSSRNRFVAGELQKAGLATFLLDLLTAEEEQIDLRTRHLRFDIDLLAERLVGAAAWLQTRKETAQLPLGLFGASTGGGAALVAAASRPEQVHAVVSRGGRPDLAGPALPNVQCPTLLIVGGDDTPVIRMNREAMAQMQGTVDLEIVPGASHLFEEPGTLEQVAVLARNWLVEHLRPVHG